MQVIDAPDVAASLTWPVVVEALRQGFAAGDTTTVPQRHHHSLDPAGSDDARTLLLMPAWNRSYSGVKVMSVVPSNRDTDIDTINGSYLLIDGSNGVPLALVDGGELTVRRTAGASLLAASILARPGSTRLTVMGSGRLAGNLARGYAELFPIDDIAVWNHRPASAERLAAELRADGFPAHAAADAEQAVAEADIVTAATLTSDPIISGTWLRPGTHVDLVGGFTPTMREADDAAISAAEVYVDTMDGALSEAGDIVQPITNGTLAKNEIRGDLFSLCARSTSPHRAADAITLFKSVGHALEDLVAAAAVFEAS